MLIAPSCTRGNEIHFINTTPAGVEFQTSYTLNPIRGSNAKNRISTVGFTHGYSYSSPSGLSNQQH